MKKSVPTFLTIFLASLVSAGPVEGVGQLLGGLGEVIVLIIQFLSDMMLDIDSFDEFLFTKLILLTIIFLVVYSTISKGKLISKNNTINIIISASISILAIRFLPDNEFINSLLVPYGAFASAIITILPLAIFFFFTHQNIKGSLFRRGAWIFYGAFFIGLWWSRRAELSEVVGWIYIGAFIVIILSFILDKYIHKMWGLKEMNQFLTGANQKTITELQSEYLRIASVDSEHASKRRKFIEEKLKGLGARLP